MASIYDKQILDEEDLKRIEQLGIAWQNTNDAASKKQLHSAAEAIRNSYGYSGGGDGSAFDITNAEVLSVAKATGDMTDALYNASENMQQLYNEQVESIQKQGEDRLREAYIKNMQDSLGIGQKLRGAGVTGGAAQTAVAYLNNSYNNTRDDIMSDTADDILEVKRDARAAKSQSDTDIAKVKRDSASERAKMLADSEKEEYERMINERDFEYKKEIDERDFEYKKETDERDFEYEKNIDERDFEYQKSQDENKQKLEQQKLAQSASKKSSGSSSSSSGANKTEQMSVSNVIALIKAGAYSESFAPILGISDDAVKEMAKSFSESEKRAAAWALLEDGIYDDSFPELLGYDADVLKNYANSRLPRR